MCFPVRWIPSFMLEHMIISISPYERISLSKLFPLHCYRHNTKRTVIAGQRPCLLKYCLKCHKTYSYVTITSLYSCYDLFSLFPGFNHSQILHPIFSFRSALNVVSWKINMHQDSSFHVEVFKWPNLTEWIFFYFLAFWRHMRWVRFWVFLGSCELHQKVFLKNDTMR